MFKVLEQRSLGVKGLASRPLEVELAVVKVTECLGHEGSSLLSSRPLLEVMVEVDAELMLLYRCRVTVTALCSMDFSSFPLDTQNCSLELESCETHIHTHTNMHTNTQRKLRC